MREFWAEVLSRTSVFVIFTLRKVLKSLSPEHFGRAKKSALTVGHSSRKLEFSSWSFLCFKAKYVLGWLLCLFA